jgi:hypothetical protein
MAPRHGVKIEVPAAARELAEEVVVEAEGGVHDFTTALHHSIANFGKQLSLAQNDGLAVARTAVSCAEKNFEMTFDYLHKLLRAQDLDEVVRLQIDFATAQYRLLAEQTNRLGQLMSKTAVDIARS